MRFLAIIAAAGSLLAPATALAGLDVPPVVYTDVQAIAAASTLIPSVCATPLADTLAGTAGMGSTCMIRTDSARPTIIQAANTTVAADCTWSVTFSKSFVSSTPIVHANIVLPAGATEPIPCFVQVRSSTVESGKCFPGQTTLLNLSIITAGLTLNPFGSTCTAGTAIMVVGRDPTQ